MIGYRIPVHFNNREYVAEVGEYFGGGKVITLYWANNGREWKKITHYVSGLRDSYAAIPCFWNEIGLVDALVQAEVIEEPAQVHKTRKGSYSLCKVKVS